MLCSGLSGPPGGSSRPTFNASSLASLSDGGCLEIISESHRSAVISEAV